LLHRTERPAAEGVAFDHLGLTPPLLRAVRESGYLHPTPIQADAIPPALGGRDVVGCAQTGTGKTAAFALPVLQHLDRTAGEFPEIRALVLTPTRELAAQIGESLRAYGCHLDLWHTVVFGGVKDGPQKQELRQGVDVLVATPGRLLDLIGQGEVSLDKVEIFVLDEADRMLDMGFLPDVRRVTAQLPTVRQTLFFSATMPPEIRQLADTLLRDPVNVTEARVEEPVDQVTQRIYFVDKPDKRRLLVDLLRHDEMQRTLVFSRTKHGANRIVKILDRAGLSSAAIHGNKSQGARTRALESFRRGDLPVLVATDLAARGIDVEGITHVINFDLPNEPETYLHRIGRTARAGASGTAISFCQQDERPYLIDIERLIGEHVERVLDHDYPPTQPPPAATDLTNRRDRRPAATKPSRRGRPGGRGGSRRGRRGRRR
jgi:ATP-dependent RNA helicase RhlE